MPSFHLSAAHLLALVTALPAVSAFWRTECGVIQLGRVDPIINPGNVSGHVHIVAGPNNFNISSNYDSLQKSLCTSCTVQADKSAYWTPYMYYQKADGTFVDVPQGGVIVYYLGRGKGNATSFPPGFRMLSGNTSLRAYDNKTMTYGTAQEAPRPVSDRVSFNCINYAKPAPETPAFPAAMNCPQGLRAQIPFQSCWDGVNLYKPDQSHVAYLSQIDNGICPPTHPVLLPHLFYEVYYSIDQVDSSDGGKFVFANGDSTGYGYHGDFMNGWDPTVQANAVQNCLESSGSGQIDDCPILKANNDAQSGSNCPQQPALVDEKVTGSLSALPGCNTPTAGPGPAQMKVCPARLITPNTPTDGQTRQIPTPGKTTSNLASGSSATYKGCYVDGTNGRALSGSTFADDKNMTTQTCGAFCQSKGFNLFGTEYARECYCGYAITTSNATQSDCSMACSGDMLAYCGGPNRLSVWSISAASAPLSSTSTSTPSATSSPNGSGPTVNNATYQGCYTDSVSTRTLTGYYNNNASQTLDTCAAAARANNLAYFGVEYGAECFAGNTIASSASSGSTACTMKCGGDASGKTTCGGSNAISLFKNDAYVPGSNKQVVSVKTSTSSATYQYAGCYTDAAGQKRTLTDYFFSDSKMTVEMCANACFGRGYSFAGTEYANECYCGGVVKNGAVLAGGGDGEYSMRCAGETGEFCGAGGRITVYERSTTAGRRRRGRR